MRARHAPIGLVMLTTWLAACCGTVHAQVWLRSAPDRLTKIGDDKTDLSRQLSGVKRDADTRVAVQLAVKADDATRALLAQDGLELLAPLGNDAFFARLSAGADVAGLAASKMLAGVSAIDPAWKLDRKLLGDVRALYRGANQVPADPAQADRAEADDPLAPVLVLLHSDVLADGQAEAVVARHAQRVLGGVAAAPVIVAEVRQSDLAALAAEDIVQWIAPALPRMSGTNAENRVLTQVEQLPASPYNLTGAGVAVMVYDSGWVQTTHVDFQGRATIVDPTDIDSISSHSTHCAGTVGGGGVANPQHRGMAPGVQILSAGLGGQGLNWLYSNPVDIEANYTAAVNAGADLSTNSISTNVSSNGFPCSWLGDYNVTDVLIDNIVRGALPATQGRAFPVVWAAGNERASVSCGTGYRMIPPPSNNKNAMVIGAVDSVTEGLTTFSSWGPSDDGRMRPDFVTGGCQNSGDLGVTSTTSGATNTGYASLCGTSMATPTVAGVCALLVQDYRAQFPELLGDPRPSLLKALLAQTAVDLGTPGPDYQFGYGSIRARSAVDLMRTGQFLEVNLAQGGEAVRLIDVPAGSGELVVTMAWDDAPGTPNVVPTLVNDIDMEIIGPGGERWRPWTLDPANPSSPAIANGPNRRDNLEQIRIASPAQGVYQLVVTGFNVPAGAQPVSVVSSHPISGSNAQPRVIITPQTLVTGVQLPGEAQTVSVLITMRADELVSGSVALRYATQAGGPFLSVPMTQNGLTWTGVIPAMTCQDQPRYFVEAQGTVSGMRTLPLAGASEAYSYAIGGRRNQLTDPLTSNAGWTVTNTPINAPAVPSGGWELATPQQTQAGTLVVQPGEDYTPGAGGLCWVTGAQAGSSAGGFDIDNLITTLTSPAYDTSGFADPTLTFWRWFNNNGNTARDDVLTVELSNDDGATWQTVETLSPTGPQSRGGWFRSVLRLRDYFAQPSNAVRFRVTASDQGNASVVEALVDEVAISDLACPPVRTCQDIDFNNNGVFPEDQDVVDFFRVLAGGMCEGCDDIDFNNNLVFPEDQDVMDFFTVLAGGACP